MEQKVIATVGGHQITEAEVEAFIRSLPREQQAYASHPDFRKQCEEQLIAVYAFAKIRRKKEKIDETEEFKNVMENARKRHSCADGYEKAFCNSKRNRR